jgi:hypothetical protein
MKYPITVKIEVFRQAGSFKKAGSNWDWRMVYRNNKIGGGSTEGYRNRPYCLENLAVVTGIDVRPLIKKAKPFKVNVMFGKAGVLFGSTPTRIPVIQEDTLEYNP